MGANKYENFDCVVVKRSEIHGADYNPRTITESALKKLRKWFKTEGKGQLAPITVNKNTMTVVSGHQRLTVLDQLNRYPDNDYDLTVAMADLDEKTEVEANVFMNNKSAMGDFDYDMLGELHDMFPDISFTDDFGFDPAEVSLILGNTDDIGISSVNEVLSENDTIQTPMGNNAESEALKEDARKFTQEEYSRDLRNQLHAVKEHNNTNGSCLIFKDDYTFTIVCVSNEEKHKLMQLLHEKESEKFVKSSKLYDIYDHKVKLREYS